MSWASSGWSSTTRTSPPTGGVGRSSARPPASARRRRPPAGTAGRSCRCAARTAARCARRCRAGRSPPSPGRARPRPDLVVKNGSSARWRVSLVHAAAGVGDDQADEPAGDRRVVEVAGCHHHVARRRPVSTPPRSIASRALAARFTSTCCSGPRSARTGQTSGRVAEVQVDVLAQGAARTAA